MSPDTKLKPSGNVCNVLQTNAVISCKRLQPVQCFTTVSTFYTVIEHILKKNNNNNKVLLSPFGM